jgi:hypothetical protein
MGSYVYIESERWTDDEGVSHRLYTVGFYGPDDTWHGDSDHNEREEAAKRAAWLNGSRRNVELQQAGDALAQAVMEAGYAINELDPRCERTGWDGGESLRKWRSVR